MKPLINFLRAFDDLKEETQIFLICMVAGSWFFVLWAIPASVVFYSDHLISQNQPTCEEVAQK